MDDDEQPKKTMPTVTVPTQANHKTYQSPQPQPQQPQQQQQQQQQPSVPNQLYYPSQQMRYGQHQMSQTYELYTIPSQQSNPTTPQPMYMIVSFYFYSKYVYITLCFHYRMV
jgi:hypothetical protein